MYNGDYRSGNDSNNPYESLSIAIIKTASQEYLSALRERDKPISEYRDGERDGKIIPAERVALNKKICARWQIKKLRKFFFSREFAILTSVEPDAIIRILNKRHETYLSGVKLKKGGLKCG